MIRTMIVDDEEHARETLALKLARYCPELELVASLATAAEAVSAIRQREPDLLFLDIEMPDGSGFRVLDSLARADLRVIFVTAFQEYAIRALRHGAVDYLLKPVDPLELQAAVARALRPLPAAAVPSLLSLASDEGVELVNAASIIRCHADGAYTRLFFRDGGDTLVSRSLGDIESLLPERHFCRIHHSHLINLYELKKYRKGRGGSVLMSDAAELPVAARRRTELLQRIAALTSEAC